ncbi:MAG: asparagine synthase family protein [Candidatus Odinarchaeia archaeon]
MVRVIAGILSKQMSELNLISIVSNVIANVNHGELDTYNIGKLKVVTTGVAKYEIAGCNVFFDGYPSVENISILKQFIENQEYSVLEKILGSFTIIIANENEISIITDPLGLKPIYYGVSDNYAIFSSMKKIIWKTNVKTIKKIPPASALTFSQGKVKNLTRYFQIQMNTELGKLNNPVQWLFNAINQYFDRLLEKVQKIGVLFSGGLDSSIVAAMLKRFSETSKIKVTLITVGVEGARDLRNAEYVANFLDLNFKPYILEKTDIEEKLLNVIDIIENSNYRNVSIGLPAFFSLKYASENGINILTSGQGADELFGGYSWHEQMFREKGVSGVIEAVLTDVKRFSDRNAERDEKIAAWHSTNLFLPFMNADIVKVAVNIDPDLKITSVNQGIIKKVILRKLAKHIGLPEEVVAEKKVAMQYGSGVDKMLDKIARETGFNKALASKYGYKGYKQLFLDCLARLLGFPDYPKKLDELIEVLNIARYRKS